MLQPGRGGKPPRAPRSFGRFVRCVVVAPVCVHANRRLGVGCLMVVCCWHVSVCSLNSPLFDCIESCAVLTDTSPPCLLSDGAGWPTSRRFFHRSTSPTIACAWATTISCVFPLSSHACVHHCNSTSVRRVCESSCDAVGASHPCVCGPRRPQLAGRD